MLLLRVYRGYFRRHFPARMAYATGGLALGARAEVQCNAVVTPRREVPKRRGRD